ncbi:MAG: hypothetical protein QNK30_16395 [Bacteroidales bacterium]|nr:hypothetical protein [Bacteroidales bacterium]
MKHIGILHTKSLMLKYLLVVLVGSILCFSVNSQDLISEIESYNSENYKEELYLQSDRDIYIVGEQIRLKIYKLNAFNKKPNNVSKVVYIELLNSKGYPVQQIKLGANNSSATTRIVLSDTLSSGNYLLRAYTNWMKNYSEKDFAFRNISIINPFQKLQNISIPSQKANVDTVLFYPEGGKLVAGIESKIAFRAIDKLGSPQNMEAVLVNKLMDTVCLVKSDEAGLGTFLLNPGRSEFYNLLYKNNQGDRQLFPVGDVESSGIVLSLIQSENTLPFRFRVKRRSNFKGVNKYIILVKSGGLVKYLEELNFGISDEFEINRDVLPSGISQVILSNQEGDEHSSRFIFNEINDNLYINVTLNKPEYSKRDEVFAIISATDANGNPMEVDLSVSVIKSVAIDENRISIDNRYEQVSFPKPENSSLMVLNDKLLLHPTINFDLKEASEPEYLPELEGEIVSGKLNNNSTDEPIGNEDVVFSLVGKSAKCQIYTTDDSGDFHFLINEYGLQEAVIQPLNNKIEDYFVELKPDFINSFNHFLPGPFYLDTTLLSELNNSIISMQVENIYRPYHQNLLKTFEDTIFPNFYGEPVESVVITDFITLTTVREVIKEIVPHVFSRKKGDDYSFRLISEIHGQIFENEPFVIVDGIPYNNIEEILNMKATDLERIDVVNLRYFIDDHIFDGILHFVTRKGNLDILEFDYSTFRQAYNTLSRESIFISPDYSTDTLKNSRIPDFRNTLYWNPELNTDKDGSAQFTLYTSDETSEYTILIEGISPDGQTGTVSKVFSTK